MAFAIVTTMDTRLLALLCIGNLVVGSSAFVIPGIVDVIAADLAVPAAAVGQAMTTYALSTAFGAPLLLVATGGWPRKHALLLALAMLVLGNAICALAPSLPWLLLGRFVLGLGSMFTPLAASLAVAAVPLAQRGTALSIIFLGFSLSYVTTVPLGAWVGLSFGWHAAIGMMVVACALMLLLSAWLLPRQMDAPGASFAGLGAVLRRPDVMRVLATTLCYFGAIFTVFSYIGPVLLALLPMSPGKLSLTLALFGVSGVAGTLLGGAANDRFGAQTTLAVGLPLLGLTMALLPLTAGSWAWMLVVMTVWGAAGFSMMSPQQGRLAALAPAQAPLLLSLNASMLYIGTALGAAVGGAALVALGSARLPWAGIPFVLVACLLLWASRAPHQPLPATLTSERTTP
jgi:MFS transporter, DHA1 family, inner membrane transport protein